MLKNRKYLAESFAAFKNSKKKKEDPFAKDEETDEVEKTEDTDDKDETESEDDKDEATKEEVEEAAEDDELEAEMKDSDDEDEDEESDDDEDEESDDDDDTELEDIDGDGDVDEDDEEIAEDETDADDEEGDDSAAPAQGGFGGGTNTDLSAMMGGGMNGMTSFKRPEWCITRVMTDNGERIAMEYQTETECEVIVGNLTYTEADSRSTEIANQLNLTVFNSETDKYLGRVSSKVVRKQDGEKKTSYKY